MQRFWDLLTRIACALEDIAAALRILNECTSMCPDKNGKTKRKFGVTGNVNTFEQNRERINY